MSHKYLCACKRLLGLTTAICDKREFCDAITDLEDELEDWKSGVTAFPDCKDLLAEYNALKKDHELLVAATTILITKLETKCLELARKLGTETVLKEENQ